jgi:hypothetical protein
MSSEWEKITDDQICSFTGVPANPETARYERILQVRLRQKLTGLIEQIHRSTQLISERTDGLKEVMQSSTENLSKKVEGLVNAFQSSTEVLSKKTDELKSTYEKIANSQGRQQFALILLSLVVAAATVLYTWITWKQVEATRTSNAIQQQMLSAQREANVKPH